MYLNEETNAAVALYIVYFAIGVYFILKYRYMYSKENYLFLKANGVNIIKANISRIFYLNIILQVTLIPVYAWANFPFIFILLNVVVVGIFVWSLFNFTPSSTAGLAFGLAPFLIQTRIIYLGYAYILILSLVYLFLKIKELSIDFT